MYIVENGKLLWLNLETLKTTEIKIPELTTFKTRFSVEIEMKTHSVNGQKILLVKRD
jgi:hypothetical protein